MVFIRPWMSLGSHPMFPNQTETHELQRWWRFSFIQLVLSLDSIMATGLKIFFPIKQSFLQNCLEVLASFSHRILMFTEESLKVLTFYVSTITWRKMACWTLLFCYHEIQLKLKTVMFNFLHNHCWWCLWTQLCVFRSCSSSRIVFKGAGFTVKSSILSTQLIKI